MGKLTAIKTKSVFQSLLNNSEINEQAIHFILDTGLIYTHGIYINGAAYGTEANGAVNLSIAGVTKALSLSTHTHSNYLEKNSNIDIGSYIIKSGNNELLKWTSSKLILGSPTYITGTAHTTRNSTNYDILDTGNFSVVAKTSTNISLQNVATIKYGSSTFLIDYAKRINGAYTFDNITYTSIGTTNVNNQQYGIITMYTDGSTPASYALIRADIPNGKLEYRTSGSTAWKTIVTGALPTVFVGSGSNHASGLVPDPGATAGTAKFLCEDGTWKTPTYTSDTNTWRSILVNGTLKLSTAITSGGLDIINGTNTTVEWTSGNKLKINSVNTWNANAVGVAGYVAAPTKAANANMTWQTDAEGVPAWRASNNHTHSYLPLSGGTLNSGSMIVWLDWGQWGAENPTYPKANGGLQWSGTSDTIKLFAEETASDNLRLVLLFGDDDSPRFEIRNKDGNVTAYITTGGAANFTALTVNNTAVSLNGHKHAYTDLTGSSTTANQAIVSNGTANGWTLKTLGSRAFDSTSYLPLGGGTMTGVETISATSAISFATRTNSGTRASYYTSGNYIHGGEDHADQDGANVQIGTWYGFGIYPTISGQTRTQGKNSFWHNARTGNTYTWGEFYSYDGSTNRKVLHEGNSSVSLSGSTLSVRINGTTQSLTNTWRGMLNNLTTSSSSTSDSLSAYLGYLLANGSARDNTKLPLAGGTMTGTLTMKTNGSGSYNQGIRINRINTSSWALLLIGKSGDATSGTGTATAGDGAWLIGTPASSNSLIFNLNDASENKGLCLKGHGTNDIKWNDNTVWHAGNDGANSGLDADLLDGLHLDRIVGTYTRELIGTSPNFDNPSIQNGLFEMRVTSETTGETGTKPFNGFAPFLTLKVQNVMMQLAGGNANGWFIRGKQSANVTLANTAWLQLACTTDNVASATKLQNARTLWGQSFDGSANISGFMLNVSGLIYGNTLGDDWSDGVNTHPWYGIDYRHCVDSTDAGKAYTSISSYFGLYFKVGAGKFIFDGGNVGIGIASPSGKLHIYMANSNATTQQTPALRVDGKLDIYDNVTGGGTNNSLLNILFRGTHEYGTAVKIHSYGNDAPTIRFSHSSNIADINSLVNTSWSVGMSYNSAYGFCISKNRGITGWGTEVVTINSSENVGIGTTSPSYKLHVNGSFNATSGYINGNTILDSGNSSKVMNIVSGAYQYTASNPLTHTSASKDGFFYHNTMQYYCAAGEKYTISCETDGTWSNHDTSGKDPSLKLCSLWVVDNAQSYHCCCGTNMPYVWTCPTTGTYKFRTNTYSNGTDNLTVHFWNFKVERGQFATDWNISVTDPWVSALKATKDGDGNIISSTYLKLSGGTLTGNITCTTSGANLKWGNITIYGGGSNGGINSLLVGDDVTIGDCNLGGIMGMKSTGTNAGFKFFNSSGTSIGGVQSTNGTLQWLDSAGTAYNVIHSGNINNQLPQRLLDHTSQYNVGSPDNFMQNGFAYGSGGTNAPYQDYNLIGIFHTASGWGHQLAFKFNGNGTTGSGYDGKDLCTRLYNAGTGTWTPWYDIITSGNIGLQSVNYATSAGNADTLDGVHNGRVTASKWWTTSHIDDWYERSDWDGSYFWLTAMNGSGSSLPSAVAYATSAGSATDSTKLPLTGGTLTGNLSFSNSGTEFRGINYGTMGDNDQWRIGGAATASNSGYMEIATADDGNEPIYVRLYTGVFTNVARTLTLLDGSGNTSLPGNLSCGSITTSGVSASGTSNRLIFRHLDGLNCAGDYNLYLLYHTGAKTYFGGDTYYINGSGYFNGSCSYASSAGSIASLGNRTTTTSDDMSAYGIYTYNMYAGAGTAPQQYMSAIGFGSGVSKIEIAGSWGDDYNGHVYWRSKSDRDMSSYPWKGWKRLLDTDDLGSVGDGSGAYLPLSGGTVSGTFTCQSVEIGHTNEINATGSSNLYLQYRNTGHLILCSNGYNCGIGLDGNSSPSYKLQVNGSVYSGGDFACNGGDIYINEPASGGAAAIWFQSEGTTKGNLRVKADGALYFYTGTAPESTGGSVYAGNFYTTSDIRKKDNIKPISNLLPIYEFNWKSDGSKSYGFIAQWLELTNPELVSGEDYKHANYSATLALYLAKLSNIVEETKEDLYAKIAKLENRIKELEASNKLGGR